MLVANDHERTAGRLNSFMRHSFAELKQRCVSVKTSLKVARLVNVAVKDELDLTKFLKTSLKK